MTLEDVNKRATKRGAAHSVFKVMVKPPKRLFSFGGVVVGLGLVGYVDFLQDKKWFNVSATGWAIILLALLVALLAWAAVAIQYRYDKYFDVDVRFVPRLFEAQGAWFLCAEVHNDSGHEGRFEAKVEDLRGGVGPQFPWPIPWRHGEGDPIPVKSIPPESSEWLNLGVAGPQEIAALPAPNTDGWWLKGVNVLVANVGIQQVSLLFDRFDTAADLPVSASLRIKVWRKQPDVVVVDQWVQITLVNKDGVITPEIGVTDPPGDVLG